MSNLSRLALIRGATQRDGVLWAWDNFSCQGRFIIVPTSKKRWVPGELTGEIDEAGNGIVPNDFQTVLHQNAVDVYHHLSKPTSKK
jgi:hypothetical protein